MDIAQRPKALLRVVNEISKDYAIGAAIGAVVLWFLPGWFRCLGLFLGAISVLGSVITSFIIDWKPRQRINVAGKAVVISGCDSGFGHMLAQKLDDLGFHVFAGCLFPSGEGAENLKKSGSNRLHVLGLDVTKDESIQEAFNYVSNNLENKELWAVVCNAGLNDGGELHWTDFDTIKRVIDVNTFGVVRVTKAFLSELIKSKGRVVAVASAAGRYTYPGMVPYCMSKQAVVSFCDGLRLEMYKWGVQVVTIEPWMYKTPITNEESVKNYLNRTWEKAPEDMKRSYPHDYLEHYLKATINFLNLSISSNPSEVVSCLEEAVTAKSPKFSYQPGTAFSKASFWVYRKFPKPIADLLIADACNTKIPK